MINRLRSMELPAMSSLPVPAASTLLAVFAQLVASVFACVLRLCSAARAHLFAAPVEAVADAADQSALRRAAEAAISRQSSNQQVLAQEQHRQQQRTAARRERARRERLAQIKRQQAKAMQTRLHQRLAPMQRERGILLHARDELRARLLASGPKAADSPTKFRLISGGEALEVRLFDDTYSLEVPLQYFAEEAAMRHEAEDPEDSEDMYAAYYGLGDPPLMALEEAFLAVDQEAIRMQWAIDYELWCPDDDDDHR